MAEIPEDSSLNLENIGSFSRRRNDYLNIDRNARKADKEEALKYRFSKMIVGKNNEPLPVIKTPLKELGKHGVALKLYFLAIKRMGYLFLVISVISVWPMYENFVGKGLEEGDKNQDWDVFTLGNQYKYAYDMEKSKAEDKIHSYKNSKIRIVIADVLYTLVFLFFVLYFHIATREKILSNEKKYITVADYAVEISNLPDKCKTDEVLEFFKKFWPVREVYLARRYNGILSSYKSRAELQRQLHYLENQNDLKKNHQTKLKKKIKKLDNSIKEKQKKLKSHDNLPVIKGFMIFEDLSDRKSCLKSFKKSNSLCRRYNPTLKFQGHQLKVTPTSEPSNINWENLEYSTFKRFFRSTISLLLVCFFLACSIAAIYTVRSHDNSLPNEKTCIVKYGINASLSLEEAKEKYEKNTEKYCYCRVQSINEIIQNSSLRSFCRDYIEKRSLGIGVRFAAVTAVVMINFFMKTIIKLLNRFEKVVSKSIEMKKIMTKVFIAMFFNTSLVVLAVNADFSSFGFVEVLPFKDYLFDSEFSDFTRRWYVQAGSTITITMILSIFSPHLLNYLIFYPRGACRRRCCLRRHETQYEINLAFQGAEFDMATRYSQILNVVFSSFLYSGGIPLLNCTCCITMFVLYWTDKFLILRHYSIPPRYSHELNTNFVEFLPFAAIFHCAFSLYMVGSENIFPEGFYLENGFLYPKKNSLSDRIVSVSGIIYIGVILIAIFIYLYLSGANFCSGKSATVKPEGGSQTFTQSEERIKLYALTSYNIRNNRDYAELIETMDAAVQDMGHINQDSENSQSQLV